MVMMIKIGLNQLETKSGIELVGQPHDPPQLMLWFVLVILMLLRNITLQIVIISYLVLFMLYIIFRWL